ncbi:rRNA maturation RNase YbeY [Listeria sp. PSOL-1]|uniref:rRNA maturation RNase YbeY n=1 Tax=Listeria sp. PSOL-1 TaxID=1844999 RepID=UPI0013D511B8|nr:rRNA maturation RNase YbeY [Listeria sp. PSOL-1]
MSILEIDMIDETDHLPAKTNQFVEDLLQFAAEHLKIEPDTEMSVTFTDNEHIQTINRDYRGKDQPTDVISFAIEELVEGETAIHFKEDEGLPRVLGDIIISVEKASEQAEAYGHSAERELGFLAVHGLLHLLGYDHMTAKEEKVMFGLQKEVLDAYGLQR